MYTLHQLPSSSKISSPGAKPSVATSLSHEEFVMTRKLVSKKELKSVYGVPIHSLTSRGLKQPAHYCFNSHNTRRGRDAGIVRAQVIFSKAFISCYICRSNTLHRSGSLCVCEERRWRLDWQRRHTI